MRFQIIGKIEKIETIAVSGRIRDIMAFLIHAWHGRHFYHYPDAGIVYTIDEAEK